MTLKGPGFPIRISSDQSLLPTPRSLSQGATSFIASARQGIHQMPFSHLSRHHAQGTTHRARQPIAGPFAPGELRPAIRSRDSPEQIARSKLAGLHAQPPAPGQLAKRRGSFRKDTRNPATAQAPTGSGIAGP